MQHLSNRLLKARPIFGFHRWIANWETLLPAGSKLPITLLLILLRLLNHLGSYRSTPSDGLIEHSELDETPGQQDTPVIMQALGSSVGGSDLPDLVFHRRVLDRQTRNTDHRAGLLPADECKQKFSQRAR